MGVRRQSREAALQVLFMYDFLGVQHSVSMESFLEHFSVPVAVQPYTTHLVHGACDNLKEIDARITCASENWSLSRMCRVDRALLRLASFEILFQEDVPHSVAINEAIEIAKRFCAEDSPNFINGVLDRVASSASNPAATASPAEEPGFQEYAAQRAEPRERSFVPRRYKLA